MPHLLITHCLPYQSRVFSLASFSVVAQSVLEYFVELVVALQTAAQIGQLGAEIQKFFQRPDLLGHLSGLEIVHAAEAQVHLELAAVRVVS